jgi:hypothetical protein
MPGWKRPIFSSLRRNEIKKIEWITKESREIELNFRGGQIKLCPVGNIKNLRQIKINLSKVDKTVFTAVQGFAYKNGIQFIGS